MFGRNESGKVELGHIVKFLKCSPKEVGLYSVDNSNAEKKVVSSVVLMKNILGVARRTKFKKGELKAQRSLRILLQ